MKKMIIFDPAMCCSTGVCGPSVDPELIRMSTVINNLEKKGITVERHGLSTNPEIFIKNKQINELINKEGVEILPVTLVDDEVIKTKGYLSNEEMAKILDVPSESLQSKPEDDGSPCCSEDNTTSDSGCCGEDGCC
ncbi:arsenical resistance operon trans-acting repressor ArsD [Natranaerovirga hydrolytica]|uniref:Arsenical resistance operon trans-acting repressor ArsD n=1 Tax=Natranaerovirga hydrolytica TaxID=680378 RepID=A0A4R1MJX9_9FIRM|nr:arsenite efflux transporter metallochaperone ArsD [Natranaerovirga hydrolytica]TCK92827.1 arsenical resistance operon trans-acting repressor ArsD [Natranaerovirga hydrolytica]